MDSSDTNGSSNDQRQQMSSSTTAKIDRSSSSVPTNEIYHRNFILRSITNWCQRYFSKISLSEGVDYHILLTQSSDKSFTAEIKCRCGSKISLVKLQKNFQLSNFYKHLVSITCTTITDSKKRSVSNKNAPNRIDSSVNGDTALEGIF